MANKQLKGLGSESMLMLEQVLNIITELDPFSLKIRKLSTEKLNDNKWWQEWTWHPRLWISSIVLLLL